MMNYCACGSRRLDRRFGRGGIVYCSSCDKPLCCAAVALVNAEKPHAAEFAYEETFVCWQHWDSVADLKVPHSEPSRAFG